MGEALENGLWNHSSFLAYVLHIWDIC